MKAFLVPLWLHLLLIPALATAQPADDGPRAAAGRSDEDRTDQAGADGDNNLELGITQLAAMYVCGRMRGNFRTLKTEARDEREAVRGTLWIRDCAADADGHQLAITLGGKGWLWVYRQKERAGAEFEVSQYASFAVDVSVTGTLDAGYNRHTQVFTLWFKPMSSPDVRFQPLTDLEVETEGLWSAVVGGVASLVMESPKAQAYQQFQAMGRQRFEQRLAQGFTAKLDFCTGRLQTRFGLDSEDSRQNSEGPQAGSDSRISAYMHPDGLILDGQQKIDPDVFEVTVNTDAPMQVQLVCQNQAEQLARAFLDDRDLPEGHGVKTHHVFGEETLQVREQTVQCPVTVVFRPIAESPQSAFEFHYQIKTGPTLQAAQPTQQCPNGSQ